MIKVVCVKFKGGGKPYYFAPGKESYEKGQGVIVETAKGLEYATVVTPEAEVEDSEIVAPLKPVVRIATKHDLEQIEKNSARKEEAIKIAKEKVAARELNMKIIDCEFAFEGNKVTFIFTAESRVDFRELIKDLSSAFHMRIELRQVNIRDEIKIMGGISPCGRPCCCIATMKEPLKASVKMAKNQGLSLNPAKISGLCGRLMCCLSYENDYYSEACKKVPKLGSEVTTPDGKGIVVNVNMLKMEVKVRIEQKDSMTYHDYKVDDIKFMRGGVEMGAVDSFNEDEELPSEEEVKERVEPAHKNPERKEKDKGNNRPERRKNDERRGEAEKHARHDERRGEEKKTPRREEKRHEEKKAPRHEEKRGNKPQNPRGGDRVQGEDKNAGQNGEERNGGRRRNNRRHFKPKTEA